MAATSFDCQLARRRKRDSGQRINRRCRRQQDLGAAAQSAMGGRRLLQFETDSLRAHGFWDYTTKGLREIYYSLSKFVGGLPVAGPLIRQLRVQFNYRFLDHHTESAESTMRLADSNESKVKTASGANGGLL
jgi:hypothetical protein